MKISGLVPFGRSFDEYRRIFGLEESAGSRKILGVADGPASFNAEAASSGWNVTSVDPIYRFRGEEIRGRFEAIVDEVIEQVRAIPDDWVWSYHLSPDDLRERRTAVLRRFREDYEQGRRESRYVDASLPRLPFTDDEFDLALCSHFLFLYAAHLDTPFHLESMRELLRVAPEVRVFPLVDLEANRSVHVDAVDASLRAAGYSVHVEKVDYEFQRGGDEMLVVTREGDTEMANG